MQTPEIFILGARRTAIGTFGGALKDVPLAELASTAVKAALQSSQVDPQRIEEITKHYGFDKPMHERLWLMLKNYAPALPAPSAAPT